MLFGRGIRRYAVLIIFVFCSLLAKAQNVTSVTLSPSGPYCQGNTVTVTYVISGLLSASVGMTFEITDNANTVLANVTPSPQPIILLPGTYNQNITIPSGLAGTNRKIKVTRNAFLLVPASTLYSGTFTISPLSVGGTVSSAQTICTGTLPVDLNLSGHTGSVVKWQRSATAAFTSPTDIAVTGTTLSGASIGTVTSPTYIRAVVKSGGCAEAFSSAVLISVTALSVGGTVSSSQTVCMGTLAAGLTLSGHTGSVVKWQRSANAGFTTPTDIAVTSTTLTGTAIGAITGPTYIRAVVKNGTCAEAFSSAALISVNPKPNGSITGIVICQGQPASLTFTATAGTAPFSLLINGISYTGISSGLSFSVSIPPVTTNYTLTQITDNNGCISP